MPSMPGASKFLVMRCHNQGSGQEARYGIGRVGDTGRDKTRDEDGGAQGGCWAWCRSVWVQIWVQVWG